MQPNFKVEIEQPWIAYNVEYASQEELLLYQKNINNFLENGKKVMWIFKGGK